MARVVNPARAAVLVYALLSTATLFAYWPILYHGFTGLDDPTYISRNPQVQGGLTWASVAWAFETDTAGNWHPVTWLSHMLDVQLFGLQPGRHHLTNLLLHVANTLLLFSLLKRISGRLWPSALVAGLFALHPVHVESVAWAAERKDVLSTFFLLLTLLAYAAYVRTTRAAPARNPKRWGWYSLALLLFASGLMSKPMVVTTPCLMLLLDYWPLRRLPLPRSGRREAAPSLPPSPPQSKDQSRLPSAAATIKQVLGEKLPFFALALVGSVLTFRAQHHIGTVTALQDLSFADRLGNAMTAYVKYLGKTIYPTDLAVFYPHPMVSGTEWPAWEIATAALLLIAVSILVLLRRRQEPWLLTGWFWYLGTLVPVIGLVQVGGQAMADRYTYIPLIGVFICLAWSAAKLVTAFPKPRLAPLAATAAVTAAVVCTGLTRHQVQYWENDLTLFQHALDVEERNPFIHGLLATAFLRQNQYGLALAHGRASLQNGAYDPPTWGALGDIQTAMGRTSEAIHCYSKAVELDPSLEPAWYRLGCLYNKSGNAQEAIRCFQAALARAPEHATTHHQLAETLWAAGQRSQALTEFAVAVRLAPDSAEDRFSLGVALATAGNLTGATEQLGEAVRLQPTHAPARERLGLVLLQEGRPEEAGFQLQAAARLAPSAEAHYHLGLALAMLGKLDEAIAQYRRALELGPNTPAAQNDLAWILATAPQDHLRNGTEAVRLAESAAQISGGRNPHFLSTLAAAYAEAGRFGDAVQAAEKTRALAQVAGDATLAQAAEERLALYRAQRPFRQSLPGK